jgi:sensor histidine kinase YesM
MRHPLLDPLTNLYIYYGFWAVVMVLHATALIYSQLVSWPLALLDAVLFNLLYSALGFSFWFTCRHTALENLAHVPVLLGHVFQGLVAALIWLGVGYGFLFNYVELSTTETEFLNKSFIWRMFIGMLYYASLSAFYYVYIYSSSLHERELKETELVGLVRQAELKSLKFQINPHFIFNSLNSINSLTVTAPELAGEMTVKLADFLRYTLSKNDKQKAALAEELEAGKLYLDIEKTRFGDRFEFVENVDEACLEVMVPSMVLQPLFENAIKHGVYDSIERITLEFTCERKKRTMLMSVRNNYDEDASARKGEGIGLKNIRSRLEIMYTGKDLMKVDKGEGVFHVQISIPL